MKSFLSKIICFILFMIFSVFQIYSQIIDHNCTDLSQIPDEWIDSAKIKLKVTYQHTSHGSQLMSGINIIKATYDGIYNFTSSSSGLHPDIFLNDYGIAGATDLGHKGNLAWRDATIDLLDNPDCNRNVVIWSWCGGVSDNNITGINTYLIAMSTLELSYPDVKFVYMTGHLDGGGVDGNLNVMNNLIRDFCINNNKTLFDFADIESYDPDRITNFMELNANDNCNYDGGNWAVEWCTENPGECLSCTCSHSQSLNCNMKGSAFWWMLATLAGWDQDTSTIEPSPESPSKYLYVDENCEGFLPDYKSSITVSDNCGIDTVIQMPTPGFKMDFTNPQVEVELKAIDVFENSTSVYFDVVLLDTISPTITVITDTLIGYRQGSYPNTSTSSIREATMHVVKEDCWITALGIYHNGYNAKMIMGLYDHFAMEPNWLLSKTEIVQMLPDTGWQRIQLIEPVYRNGRDSIWIATVKENIGTGFRYGYFEGSGGLAIALDGQNEFIHGMPDNFGVAKSVTFNYASQSYYAYIPNFTQFNYTDTTIKNMFLAVERYIHYDIEEFVNEFDWGTSSIGKILDIPNAVCKPLNTE